MRYTQGLSAAAFWWPVSASFCRPARAAREGGLREDIIPKTFDDITLLAEIVLLIFVGLFLGGSP
jgi:hypothetical protein